MVRLRHTAPVKTAELQISDQTMACATPRWLERAAYPFASHHADLSAGRMLYVDEVQGEVLLLFLN
jgi:hypothetical protein